MHGGVLFRWDQKLKDMTIIFRLVYKTTPKIVGKNCSGPKGLVILYGVTRQRRYRDARDIPAGCSLHVFHCIEKR